MRALLYTDRGDVVQHQQLTTIQYESDTDEYVLRPANEWSETVRVDGLLLTVEAGRTESLAVELATDGPLETPTTPKDADPTAYDFGRPEVRHEEDATYLLNVYALVHASYWDEYAARSGGVGYSEPPTAQTVRECVTPRDTAYLASFNSAWGSGTLDGQPTRIGVYTDAQGATDTIEPSPETYDRVEFALAETEPSGL